MNRRRDHSLDDMEWDGEYDTGEGALPPPTTSVLNGWTLSTDDEKQEVRLHNDDTFHWTLYVLILIG